MGNHRFRLSDMMPNAWFHKLKVMGRASRNATTLHASKKPHPTRTGGPSTPKPLPPPLHPPAEPPYLQPRRASYYFPSRAQEKGPGGPGPPIHPRASDTLFPIDPPRKSKKKSRRKQPRPSHELVSSAGSWSCRATLGAVWEGEAAMLELPPSPETPRRRKEDHPDGGGGGEVLCFGKLITAEHYENCDSVAAWSRSCSCNLVSPAAEDVVTDMGSNSSSSTAKFAEIGLPPILTKQPANKASRKPCTKLVDDAKILSSKPQKSHKMGYFPPPKETQKSSLRRPSPAGTQGLRIRATSPRLASKKVARAHRSRKAAATTPRKGLSESFAVVKSSSDPQRDFRDSMMEMIVENNIRASTDLEDLLACYLSLNANEYHDVIVKVFEQIWFDLTDVRCREVHR